MSDARIMVVDPNLKRRRKVLEACADKLAEPVMFATTLDDAYQMAELHKPARIGVSAEFTRTSEFQALLDLMHYIGAEVLTYGPVGSLGAGRVYQVEDSRGLDDFVRALTSGLAPMRPQPHRRSPAAPPRPSTRGPSVQNLLLIGASTGGVTALETIVAQLPSDSPPTLIVQHMRPGFGEGLIRRLDSIARLRVVAAGDRMFLESGTVYVAAGNGRHLGVEQRSGLVTKLLDESAVSGHCPSVDVLFDHGARLAGNVAVAAALLTGMGADGAAGLCRLRAAGAYTIAQDKDSSVVWGMPRVAVEMGGAEEVLPLNRIAEALLRGRTRSSSASMRAV